jgi:hypothetical protein
MKITSGFVLSVALSLISFTSYGNLTPPTSSDTLQQQQPFLSQQELTEAERVRAVREQQEADRTR